jgi:hypothetical protein
MVEQSLCGGIILTFIFRDKTFKKLKRGDENFFMTDGIQMVPRAGMEISQRCPDNYKSLIQECLEHGWLVPVAYVKEKELFWEVLGD